MPPSQPASVPVSDQLVMSCGSTAANVMKPVRFRTNAPQKQKISSTGRISQMPSEILFGIHIGAGDFKSDSGPRIGHKAQIPSPKRRICTLQGDNSRVGDMVGPYFLNARH
jgi:hypothetical protein